MSDDLLGDLVRVYAAEAAGLVEQIGEALDDLSVAHDSPAAAVALRRSLHSFKGGAYTSGLRALGDLAHALEEALVDPSGAPVVDRLQAGHRAVGHLEELLDDVARTGVEPVERIAEVRAEFEGALPATPTAPAPRSRVEDVSERPRRDAPAVVGRVDLVVLEQLALRALEARASVERASTELAAAARGLRPEEARRLDRARETLADLERSVGFVSQELSRLRLRPVGELLATVQRAFSDALARTGKIGELVVDGGDVLLDRRVAESISQALIHLVRNAVDHGFDGPEARAAAGKPLHPTVRVACAARGIRVAFTVADDGGGFDLATLRRTALARGRLADDTVSDEAVARLVLEGGLSSRAEVSETSGRGAGLDAARGSIERLGGQIDVTTRPGEGTTFRFEVPVSLATQRMLVVRRGEQRLAVPLQAAQRVVRLSEAGAWPVNGRLTLVIEDSRRIDVRDLASVLGLTAAPGPPLAVVLALGTNHFAVAVDAVEEVTETHVRAIGEPVTWLPLVAGLGTGRDGSIFPVLDLVDLFQATLAQERQAALGPSVEVPALRRTILVVDDSVTTRTLERTVLEHAGHAVVTATNGTEAWRLLEAGGVDLIVTDYEMPELDGLALLRRMRADPRFRSLPAIMVTSRTDAEAAALEAGANRHVLKRAFDQETLLDHVAELLAAPRLGE